MVFPDPEEIASADLWNIDWLLVIEKKVSFDE